MERKYVIRIYGGEGYPAEKIIEERITELTKRGLFEVAVKELYEGDAKKLIDALKMKKIRKAIEEEGEYRKRIVVDYTVYECEDDDYWGSRKYAFNADGRFLKNAKFYRDTEGYVHYLKKKDGKVFMIVPEFLEIIIEEED